MSRWVTALVAVAAGSMLASCGSSQESSTLGAQVAPGAIGGVPSVTPLKDCGSAGGVTVKPCPVHLNVHTQSVTVRVKGPGVVQSYLGRINGCFNGKLCYNAERYGNSELKWVITPGSSCGSADVEFDGMNASGGEVGYFFLKIANHYCP